MNVRVLTFDDAGTEALWNSLLAQTPHATFFQTVEWNRTWWNVFGASRKDRSLALLFADNGAAATLVPLYFQHRRILATELWCYARFLAHELSPYQSLLGSDACGTATLQAVADWMRWMPNHPWLELGDLSDEDTASCAAGISHDFNVFETGTSSCYSLDLDGSEEIESRFSPSMRRAWKRAARLRGEGGDVSMHVADGTSTEARNTLIELSMKRFGSSSFFADPTNAAFFHQLGECARERVLLTILMMNGMPIHAICGFLFRGTYAYFLAGFDPAASTLQPGYLHFHHLFEYLRTVGIERFDFLRGEERYKREYGSKLERRHHLCIVPQSARTRWRLASHVQSLRATWDRTKR